MNNIWRIRPTTGQKELVLRNVASFRLESPDGKSLLYQPKIRNSPLMMQPIGGGPARQLVSCVALTQFSVRGNGVYYSPCHDGTDMPVHVIDPVTGHDRFIGTLEHGSAWNGLAVSPDGKTILYRRLVREGEDLMLIENFR